MSVVVTTGGHPPPCCPIIPCCVDCGTARNSCHCRVLGPTLGVVAFAVAAVIEWPLGALVWVFKKYRGRRIMAHPALHVYPAVSRCLPI